MSVEVRAYVSTYVGAVDGTHIIIGIAVPLAVADRLEPGMAVDLVIPEERT